MTREVYFVNSPAEIKRLNIKFDDEDAKTQLLDMGYKKGMRFLDVGCGTGRMCQLVSRYDRRNKSIHGVDVNAKHIDFARHEAVRTRPGGIVYTVANAYQLPYPDNCFDFVWSRFFFEYLSEPEKVLKEMKRVVKKNGIIAVGDIDGNCVFNYPMDATFEARLRKIIALVSNVGFDPYVGRKLFSLMRTVRMRNIAVKQYPYHNLYGVLKKNDMLNWTIKLGGVFSYIEKHGLMSADELSLTKRALVDYLHNKDRYIYSTLIFASGIK